MSNGSFFAKLCAFEKVQITWNTLYCTIAGVPLILHIKVKFVLIETFSSKISRDSHHRTKRYIYPDSVDFQQMGLVVVAALGATVIIGIGAYLWNYHFRIAYMLLMRGEDGLILIVSNLSNFLRSYKRSTDK